MYEPTPFEAIDAYIATTHYHVPLSIVGQPLLVNVKQTSLNVFRMLPIEKEDASGRLLDDVALCLYDKPTKQWLVRLQDGTIMLVSNTGDGFVVMTIVRD